MYNNVRSVVQMERMMFTPLYGRLLDKTDRAQSWCQKVVLGCMGRVSFTSCMSLMSDRSKVPFNMSSPCLLSSKGPIFAPMGPETSGDDVACR